MPLAGRVLQGDGRRPVARHQVLAESFVEVHMQLQIIGAAYGLTDVTTKVAARVNGGASPQSLSILASDSVFGDSWQGTRKSLTVVYRYGDTGNPLVATARQDETLTING